MDGESPVGVVEARESLVGELERFEHVAFEDIRAVWSIFASKQTSFPSRVTRRLENLFWRIMVNELLLRRLNGEKVAQLFRLIQEDNRIRTTY